MQFFQQPCKIGLMSPFRNWRGFPHSSVGKSPASNAGDPGSIPGWGRSPGEGNGNLLQYSCLDGPLDGGAWRATVHGVARVRHDWATKLPPPTCSVKYHAVSFWFILFQKQVIYWFCKITTNWNQQNDDTHHSSYLVLSGSLLHVKCSDGHNFPLFLPLKINEYTYIYIYIYIYMSLSKIFTAEFYYCFHLYC